MASDPQEAPGPSLGQAPADRFQFILCTNIPADPNTNTPPQSYAKILCRKLGTMAGTRCVHSLLGALCQGSPVATELVRSAASRQALHSECLKRLVLRLPYLGESLVPNLLRTVDVALVEASAQQTFRQAAGTIGAPGSLVVASCEFLCRQGMNTVWLLKGQLTPEGYRLKTVKNAIGAAGGVGGTVTGMAFGSVVAPGVGTGVGSAIGGFLGSYMAEMVARNLLCLTVTASPPSEGGDEADWQLEEVDIEEAVDAEVNPRDDTGGLSFPIELLVCFEAPPDWELVTDADSGCEVTAPPDPGAVASNSSIFEL